MTTMLDYGSTRPRLTSPVEPRRTTPQSTNESKRVFVDVRRETMGW